MTGEQLYIMWLEEHGPPHSMYMQWDKLLTREKEVWDRVADKINKGDLP